MKKTLCKAIHEADERLFICIEDIQQIFFDGTLVVICPKYTTYTFNIKFETKEKSKNTYKKIIKELEEYYGLDCKR